MLGSSTVSGNLRAVEEGRLSKHEVILGSRLAMGPEGIGAEYIAAQQMSIAIVSSVRTEKAASLAQPLRVMFQQRVVADFPREES